MHRKTGQYKKNKTNITVKKQTGKWKKMIIGLVLVSGINLSLFADLAVGISDNQSIFYINEVKYFTFDGLGVDCEYDFLKTPLRPMVGVEFAFYGIGPEITLKIGGIFDFYRGNINTICAQLNYRIGYNEIFYTFMHGADCLLCYEYSVNKKLSLYTKSGLAYRYEINGYHFLDIPVKLGIKLK